MTTYRTVDVRDCLGTLASIYRLYQGKGRASFEGDLRALELHELAGSTSEETVGLKRQTRRPRLDFVVVPLTKENIASLNRCLSGSGLLGRNGVIVHTQVEVDDTLAFAACDNFDRSSTFSSQVVPEVVLADLKAKGFIRDYSDA